MPVRLKNLMMMSFLLLSAGCAGAAPHSAGAADPQTGKFTVSAGASGEKLPMQVFYAAPADINADTRIVFVLHGNRRDADHYRDIWAPFAQKYGFLVIAPEFSRREFPGYWRYQMGNAFTAGGERVPSAETAYAALGRIFDAVRDKFHVRSRTYDIFGHSAGAQFVHRMVLFRPQARIHIAIAANAGNYTVPDVTAPLPFGVKDVDWTLQEKRNAFAARLWVMVGGDDTNPNSRVLNRTPGAMVQGVNRLQRAHYFFHAAQQAAKRASLPFNWKLQVVEHVGHSPRDMSTAAAKIFGADSKNQKH